MSPNRGYLAAVLLFVFLQLPAIAQYDDDWFYGDVPFVPTPDAVVDGMLDLAGVTEQDVVLDLGCGDGRIVIAAAKNYGARGIGVDLNPTRIAEAKANAKAAGMTERTEFREGDFFKVEIADATVVTLYLLTTVNEKLKPRLLKDLKPGTRVVSHRFGMGDWKPVKEIEVDGRPIYLWTIPERTAERRETTGQ